MSIVLWVQTARETLSDNIGHKSSSIAIDMKTIKEGFQFPTGCTFFGQILVFIKILILF